MKNLDEKIDAIVQASEYKKIVFFLPRHATSWNKMFQLAKILKEYNEFYIIFIITNNYLAERSKLLKGIAGIIDIVNEISSNPYEQGKQKSNGFLCDFNIILKGVLYYRYEVSIFNKLFNIGGQKILLIPGDRELSPVCSAIKSAKNANIKRIIATTAFPNPDALQKHRIEDNEFRVESKYKPSILNLLSAFLLKQQVHSGPEGKTLFSPGWRTFVLLFSGMLSRKPWVQGGGNSNYVLETSNSHAEEAVKLGRDKNKNLVIGDYMLDSLHQELRNKKSKRAQIIKYFEWDSNPDYLILFSIPNDYEHGICDLKTHMNRMREYSKKLLLLSNNSKVLISLHPKAKKEDYLELVNENGFYFSPEPLSNILPVADLFVTGPSSTIPWAMLCEIRTIVLDYLEYDNDIFSSPAGLLTIKTVKGFEKSLSNSFKLINDENDIKLRKSYAKKLSEDMRFDGKSGERLSEFLETLI